jgi:hypothetical protein
MRAFTSATVTGQNGDQSPGDVLRAMLDEIDDEARAERAQIRLAKPRDPASSADAPSCSITTDI